MQSFKIITIGILFLQLGFALPSHAQQPSKKEQEEMLKMLKQAGIDPSMVQQSAMAMQAKTPAGYYEFDEFQVPQKNPARIRAIPAVLITGRNLPAYLLNVQKCIAASLAPAELAIAEQLISKAGPFPDTLAYMASGLWMTGNYLPALYLMGKACEARPNVTNLNNYGAFLVMTGAEELALPVLQKLNREHPQNSIILNNIGQAWFGLGELDRAKNYLDSATRIFATNSQANQTKCVIQENKGDKNGAIQSMKLSVKGAYSPAKESMLRKLGYKLSAEDLGKSALHMPADPLGFSKWMTIIPPFPKSYKEQILYEERWKDFYQAINEERSSLQEKAARLNLAYTDSLEKRARRFSANPFNNQFTEPYLSAKATKVLKYYTTDKDGHNAAQAKLLAQQQTLTMQNMEQYKKNAISQFQAIMKTYGEQVGEGKPVPPDACPDVLKLYDTYVKNANTDLEVFYMNYLKSHVKQFEANAYFTQYITDLQPLIDFTQINMKIAFLNDLTSFKPVLDYQSEFAWGCIEKEMEKEHAETHKLAEWDDLHCDRNITFSVPFIGSCHFDCNSTKVNLDPLILPFKAGFEQKLKTGEFVNASASVGYGPVTASGDYDFVQEKGSVKVEVSGDIVNEKIGSVKVKAGAGASATLEFGKHGISDFIMEANGGVKIGNDAIKVSGDAHVNWSWEAGGSGEAKGSMSSKAMSTAIKAVNFIK